LPKGWEARPFVSFLDIVGGGTPKTKIAEYWGGDIPWFSVVDTPEKGGVFVRSTEKTITEKGLVESSARLIPAGTTIITARGTVGNIAMAAREMTFNQSCYALRAQAPVGDRFVYLATERMVQRLQAMAHGSVFSTITRATFESLTFPWVGEPLFEKFEELMEPLFAKIDANGEANETLAATRDLLLPKLMSGEIRLRAAEAVA
jgi:type I restriction enzyme S subunit